MGWVVGAEPGVVGNICFPEGLEWQTDEPTNLASVLRAGSIAEGCQPEGDMIRADF